MPEPVQPCMTLYAVSNLVKIFEAARDFHQSGAKNGIDFHAGMHNCLATVAEETIKSLEAFPNNHLLAFTGLPVDVASAVSGDVLPSVATCLQRGLYYIVPIEHIQPGPPLSLPMPT